MSPQGKPDLNTALPVRQTASIFKQPVTKITNHPSNKVKSDPQKAVEQPRQVSVWPGQPWGRAPLRALSCPSLFLYLSAIVGRGHPRPEFSREQSGSCLQTAARALGRCILEQVAAFCGVVSRKRVFVAL